MNPDATKSEMDAVQSIFFQGLTTVLSTGETLWQALHGVKSAFARIEATFFSSKLSVSLSALATERRDVRAV